MINNKTAKECIAIMLRYFNDDQTQLNAMFLELSKVKGNQSFHDSMHLLYNLTLSYEVRTVEEASS